MSDQPIAPRRPRAELLADALVLVASATHSMVGIIDKDITPDEIDTAEKLLLSRLRAQTDPASRSSVILNRALDQLVHLRRHDISR